MEQALTCDRHPSDKLIRVQGDSGPFLRCALLECEFKRELPLDQRMREAGAPSLLDLLPA